MNIGKIKWFDAIRGYGFIERGAGFGDVFVHYSSIMIDGYKTLEKGQTVSFDVVTTPKGLEAQSVNPIWESDEDEK